MGAREEAFLFERQPFVVFGYRAKSWRDGAREDLVERGEEGDWPKVSEICWIPLFEDLMVLADFHPVGMPKCQTASYRFFRSSPPDWVWWCCGTRFHRPRGVCLWPSWVFGRSLPFLVEKPGRRVLLGTVLSTHNCRRPGGLCSLSLLMVLGVCRCVAEIGWRPWLSPVCLGFLN
jgi:hypothetical protein